MCVCFLLEFWLLENNSIEKLGVQRQRIEELSTGI